MGKQRYCCKFPASWGLYAYSSISLGSRHTFLPSREKAPQFLLGKGPVEQVHERMGNPRVNMVPENVRHTMKNSITFSFLPTFHLPCFSALFSNCDMQLSLEELPIGSQEPHPVSKEERMAESEEAKNQWEAAKDAEERQLKAKISAQKAEILKLRTWKEKYTKKYAGAKERTAKLEHQIRKASEAHQETLEKRDQQIRAVADRLTRAEELLALRSAELSVAQSFLSTTDSLSEAEVLGIVRDLNENIFQVAANLTEEWEKLGSSRTGRFSVTEHDVDALSLIYGPALIQSALKGDPTAVTFLVQSCLCHLATQIASSWRHDQKLTMLESVHKRLSASSEYTSHATSGI